MARKSNQMGDRANRSLLKGLNAIGWGPGKSEREVIPAPVAAMAQEQVTFSRYVLKFGETQHGQDIWATTDEQAISAAQTRLDATGYTTGELLLRENQSVAVGARPYRRLITSGYEEGRYTWQEPINIESESCRMTGRIYHK